MAKAFNRHFQFLGSSGSPRPSGRLWLPAADVYETEDGWVVKVELAGVAAEDVEIEIQGKAAGIQRRYQGVSGIELGYQQSLTFLPAPFDGFGVSVAVSGDTAVIGRSDELRVGKDGWCAPGCGGQGEVLVCSLLCSACFIA